MKVAHEPKGSKEWMRVRELRRVAGWIFAVECVLLAASVWMIHYPPNYGEDFIHGGNTSPPLTAVAVCAFYFAVISTLGIAWWTIGKERPSSRFWGVAASIASLFSYVDPSYFYQIQRRGVWVHWAICVLGLISFLAPQAHSSGRVIADDRLDSQVPNAGKCYLWGVVFPLVYLLTQRRSDQNFYLRFHCIQCLTLYSLGALSIVFEKIWQGAGLVLGVILASYFIALYKAERHKRFRLPLIGAFAEWLS